MAKEITAYKGADGTIYETKDAAEKAELSAAIHIIATAQASHLMNVVTGHSACQKTRDAIELLASRLAPLAEPTVEAR